MTVSQATIQQEELQWNQMPDNWSDLVKRDYQEKTNGLSDVAEVANEANATASAEANKNANQDKAIEQNRKNILDTSNKVSVLSERVSKNTSEISGNATAIGENKQATETNAENLKTHEDSTSAHGVKGNNVGTEDFAQELVGGVVLLASNITELANYSAQAAPEAYNQEEEQEFRDGVQSEINKLIAKVNEIVKGQIAAKQMGPNVPIT